MAVDSHGGAVVDPTQNVLDLVDAAVRRLDDLRAVTLDALRREAEMRADYEGRLRTAETARIDAIRAVDVGAVNRAAEVSAAQALTLATQVATSAETLRTQVAAAATASNVALAAALEPIQKDIADLRRVQYETAGGKDRTADTRLNIGAILGGLSVFMVLMFGVISVVITLTH
jgi:hypothetical protein